MVTNCKFRESLIDYVIKTDIDIISGDALIILSDIYSDEFFRHLINEDLIIILFNFLNIINNEDNLNSIIELMTKISRSFNIIQDNIFLKVYRNHPNRNLFTEALVRLINKQTRNKSAIYDVIECLINIMEYTQSSFLHQNDLKSLVNFSIKILKTTNTEETRIYYLRLLYRITKYDNKSYQKKELIDVLSDNKNFDKFSDEAKELSRQVLENIKNSSY
jgi:hypothetical protein